jgi:putative ABC transport system permease protein
MYIFENAFRNVLRNKGRNTLVGAIILAVIVTTVIALMISTTASGIIDDYKGRFSSEVQIKPNMQKVRDEAMKNSTNGMVRMTMPTLSAEEYIAYGESEYLAGSLYTASAGVVSDNLTSIDGELGGGNGVMITRMGGMPGEENGVQPKEFMMSLQGNKFSEFEDGTRALSSGEMPDAIDECLVSSELAELNNIKIGDTFTFSGEVSNLKEGIVQPTSYTLTVVGTYYDLTEEYGTAAQQNAYTNRRNEILTTYDTVAQEFVAGMNGIRIEGAFYLKEPGMLDAFTSELRNKGLAEVFDATTDTATYEKIVGPVEGLKGISVTFMIVVLVFGGIIIALLSSIAIRERKYEIGVLRAMGMKKLKVALGLWTEMIIVTCACLVIGLGIGSAAAQPVTNTLLEGQIQAAEQAQVQSQSPYGGMGGMMMGSGGGMLSGTANTNAEPLSELDVSLDLNTTLEITGIALSLATLAALISISRITKYEPIKILMERN